MLTVPHKVTNSPRLSVCLLAFDPGVSVGVCGLDATGNVLMSQTLSWDHLDLDAAYQLRKTYSNATEIVVEKGPRWSSNHRREIQSVEEVLTQVFTDIHWVQPSQWKGTPQARDADIPLGAVTQHERDVVRMATWFHETRERRVTS